MYSLNSDFRGIKTVQLAYFIRGVSSERFQLEYEASVNLDLPHEFEFFV